MAEAKQTHDGDEMADYASLDIVYVAQWVTSAISLIMMVAIGIVHSKYGIYVEIPFIIVAIFTLLSFALSTAYSVKWHEEKTKKHEIGMIFGMVADIACIIAWIVIAIVAKGRNNANKPGNGQQTGP